MMKNVREFVKRGKRAQAAVDALTGVGAYVRVSSRAQNHATQRAAIERVAAARDDRIGVWFEEKRSGAKLARPVLDRVRELARAGELRKLYVFRLDRLTRSGIRDTLSILQELREAGCAVQTVADGFDLEGTASDVVVAVLAWAASMERLATDERISAARDRIEAEGGRWGRPQRLDPGEVRAIRKLRVLKRSIRAIAVALKVPRSTVADVLSGKPPYTVTRRKGQKAAPKKGKRVASG